MTYCLDNYDFETLSRKESDPRKRIRLLALQHLKEGRSKTWTAAAMKRAYRTILFWSQVFEQEGIDGLSDKPGRGRKSRLTQQEKDLIRDEIVELQNLREGGRITGHDVVNFLQDNYDVTFHINSIYRFLKEIGLVWITGRSVHPKANLEEQENFKKEFQRSRKSKYPSKRSA